MVLGAKIGPEGGAKWDYRGTRPPRNNIARGLSGVRGADISNVLAEALPITAYRTANPPDLSPSGAKKNEVSRSF